MFVLLQFVHGHVLSHLIFRLLQLVQQWKFRIAPVLTLRIGLRMLLSDELLNGTVGWQDGATVILGMCGHMSDIGWRLCQTA